LLAVVAVGNPDPTIGELDFDQDGIPDAEDADADGDGLNDLLDDPFVDLNGDGLDDDSGESEAEALMGFDACGATRGTDNNSSNVTWDDNCFVFQNGEFASSLYTVGIQRVVFCEGFDDRDETTDYRDFADGIYGPNTENAVRNFQRDEVIADDGIVGNQTWGRLEDRLDRLSADGITPEVYGFIDGVCSGIPLFYLSNAGWDLARNAPNEDVAIPFSTAVPDGL